MENCSKFVGMVCIECINLIIDCKDCFLNTGCKDCLLDEYMCEDREVKK